MIINTGARTDTVNYYSDWLLNRFNEGFCYVKNPMFPNHITRYDLNPKIVDCIIFCSKNYEPILPRFNEIFDKFNIFCYYTITAYEEDIEPRVPTLDKRIETLIKLSNLVGKNKVAWRFDPLMLTTKYTKEFLFKKFEYVASKISKHIAFAEFSFIEMYKHIENRIDGIKVLTEQDKDDLAAGLAKIAKKFNIKLQTCEKAKNYAEYGIGTSACITPKILEMANPNIEFKNITCKGLRQGCGCMPQRDIGEYNTCLNMCAYCYANKDENKVLTNFKKHNKKAPILIGKIEENCIINKAEQKTMLIKNKSEQTSMFN